jgi:hypothetical protein
MTTSLLPEDWVGQIQINVFKGGGSVTIVPKHEIVGIGSFKKLTTQN